jgi:hypothetical protein
VLLTDDIGKGARAVAAVERRTSRHGKVESSDEPDGTSTRLRARLRRRSRSPSRRPPRPSRKQSKAHGAPDWRAAEVRDRAPPVEAGTRGAATVSRLLFGAPAAPEGGRLRLLPSGPDLVHGSSSPRDRTINIAHRALTSGPVPLGRGFSPRAPLAPRLARSTLDRSAPTSRAKGAREPDPRKSRRRGPLVR